MAIASTDNVPAVKAGDERSSNNPTSTYMPSNVDHRPLFATSNLPIPDKSSIRHKTAMRKQRRVGPTTTDGRIAAPGTTAPIVPHGVYIVPIPGYQRPPGAPVVPMGPYYTYPGQAYPLPAYIPPTKQSNNSTNQCNLTANQYPQAFNNSVMPPAFPIYHPPPPHLYPQPLPPYAPTAPVVEEINPSSPSLPPSPLDVKPQVADEVEEEDDDTAPCDDHPETPPVKDDNGLSTIDGFSIPLSYFPEYDDQFEFDHFDRYVLSEEPFMSDFALDPYLTSSDMSPVVWTSQGEKS